MATIVLQGISKLGKSGKPKDVTTTQVVGASPGRVHYATFGGKDRTLERVGLDASGNEVYRDQNRDA